MKVMNNNYVQLSKFEREALSMYVSPVFDIALTDALTCLICYDIFGAAEDKLTLRYTITLSSKNALEFENKLKVKLKNNSTSVNFKIVINKNNITNSYFEFDDYSYINDDNKELFKKANRQMTANCRLNDVFKSLYNVITDTDIDTYTYYFCEGESIIKVARADTSNPFAIRIEPRHHKAYSDLNVMIQEVYDISYKVTGNAAIVEIYRRRRNLNESGHIWYATKVGTPLHEILEANYML